MSDYFPPEILNEILERLPSKSLCRFLSVSKSFHTLITNKSFISSHLHRNLNHHHTNSHLLLRLFNYDQRIETFSFFQYYQTTPLSFSHPSLILNPPLQSFVGYNRIVGHCQGLLCLTDDIFSDNLDIVLWNPSIRKSITLPNPQILPDRPHMTVLGFGVDFFNRDFKVVRIVYQADTNLIYELPPLVEVYSLSTGVWRRINVGVKQYMRPVTWNQQYVDGCSHWANHCKNGEFQNMIVSFDMNHEVFGEILLPKDLAHTNSTDWVVTVYKECLAVVGVDPTGDCFLWVMTEYGNTESWTKLYRVDVDLPSRLVGFTKNGDILMRTSQDQVALLNPNNESVVELGVFGSGRAMHAHKYVESLVLIDV